MHPVIFTSTVATWHVAVATTSPYSQLCIPCISVGTGHNTPCVDFKCMVFERCVVVQAYVLQHCIGDTRLNTYMHGWSKVYAVAPNSVDGMTAFPTPVTRHRRTRSHSTGPVTHTAGIQYPVDPIWGPTAQSHTSIQLCCLNSQKADTSAKLLKAFSPT